jgi:DNA modification methylase
MFSFVGDTVLDPFLGSGTTTLAACQLGRNSIGYEVDETYLKHAHERIRDATSGLFNAASVTVQS